MYQGPQKGVRHKKMPGDGFSLYLPKCNATWQRFVFYLSETWTFGQVTEQKDDKYTLFKPPCLWLQQLLRQQWTSDML